MTLMLLVGALAGVVTTVAGSGGGLLLTLGLLTVAEPAVALALTGPALLLGNLHRVWLYGDQVRWPIAGRYAAGAVPGAVVGGLVALAAPPGFVRVAAATLAVLAAARVLGRSTWRLPAGWVIPGGALVGFATATTGGGGLVHGPMLLSAGLTDRPYVATGAVGAATIHTFRLGTYGAGGWLDGPILTQGAVLAACLLGGNLIGHRLRPWLPDRAMPHVELGVVLVGVGLALAGLR